MLGHTRFFRRNTVQDSTELHSILETARSATLDKTHVKTLVDILIERGFLVGATLSDNGPSSELLIDLLKRFWDYDSSEYVAEKKAYGQAIGRRHCQDSLVRLTHRERQFPETRVGDVTRNTLRDLQMDLSKKGLAPRTINAIVEAGTVALRWLHERGDIAVDPTEGLRRFSGKPKERGILTTDEIGKLFRVQWYDDRSRVASLVAATCGLRAGEVLALRPDDIDEDRLHVRHSWCRTGHLKETKTGETRDVPLLQEVRRELLRLAAENPHGAGPVGLSSTGRRPTRQCLRISSVEAWNGLYVTWLFRHPQK